MATWHKIHSTAPGAFSRVNDLVEIQGRILTVESTGFLRLATISQHSRWPIEEHPLRQGERPMHLRCVALSPSRSRGFIGVLRESDTRDHPRLLRMQDPTTWDPVVDLPEHPVEGICGLSFPTESAAFAAGTYSHRTRPSVWRCDIDEAGEHWRELPLRQQVAHLVELVDVHFWDENHGVVVGGRFDVEADVHVPVVARTRDGGGTWSLDRVSIDSATTKRSQPRGRYGWKFFALDDAHAYIAIASYGASDPYAFLLEWGADSNEWTPLRIPAPTSQENNLHGVAFVRDSGNLVGWACGHGERAVETKDGGRTWRGIPDLFDINRFEAIDGTLYAVGGGLYRRA